MGKIVVPHAVERKVGFLYYVDGEGNVCEAELKRRKKGETFKGKKKKKE